MEFNSYTFLFLFLPCVLLIYFILPNKFKNFVLLTFSLFFYAWGEPKYVYLMLIMIIVNYFLALFISKNSKKKTLLLVLSILINIGVLGYYKYFTFLIDNLNRFTSHFENFKEVLLPIGISFYTFQIMSYVIDVYRGKVEAQKNPLKLALYVSFFPQLIAGPIVKYADIEKEIDNRKTTIDDVVYGIKRFIIGLAKKILIANKSAYIVDTIYYLGLKECGSLLLVIMIIAFGVQIYYDFSGYSDMAIGLGRIFGFHFKENFNEPYTSSSVSEFWQRWHISLTSWFKDYVYIPLGGNRVGKKRLIINLLLVWFLTGLWHGASWHFILWGLYFGIIIVTEKTLFKSWIKKRNRHLGVIITLVLVFFGWIFFRAEYLSHIVQILRNLFIYKKSDFSIITENYNLLISFYFLVLGIICLFPFFKNKWKLLKDKSNSFIYLEYIILICLFFYTLLILQTSWHNPFVYFRF